MPDLFTAYMPKGPQLRGKVEERNFQIKKRKKSRIGQKNSNTRRHFFFLSVVAPNPSLSSPCSSAFDSLKL